MASNLVKRGGCAIGATYCTGGRLVFVCQRWCEVYRPKVDRCIVTECGTRGGPEPGKMMVKRAVKIQGTSR